MSIFDYQNEKNTQLLKNAMLLSGHNVSAATDPDYVYSEQDGWRILDGETLNYSGFSNPHGAFYGETLLKASAECNIMGKYDDNGKLVGIGINFWGTGTYASAPSWLNNIDTALDAANDLLSAFIDGFADNYVLDAYKNLMSAVARFATEKGLTGHDITITGFSLGGLAVNSMATLSAQGVWDGFYEDSNYIAFASPTQNIVDDKVLNIGFENDPVYRVLTGHSLTLDSIFAHDAPLETCTNNIVSFNDYYAGVTDASPVISILNPDSWATHNGKHYFDSITRIMDSEIYDLTHQNSNIVVSNLSEAYRETTWVTDLNKHTQHVGSTFIIGTETNDLLKGGKGNDYLCGGGGDDTFKDHSGYNIIYGGSGTNTYMTECKVGEFTVSHDAGGTLYFKFNNGDITRADNIQYVNGERVTFNLLGFEFTENTTWKVTDYALESDKGSIDYASSFYAATENSFTVSVASENGWFYAGENDSTISVSGSHNSFISGHADDAVYLNGSDNTLLFYGDFGHDTIYNLSASDTLVFMANKDIADNDDYLNHLSFDGDNALLTYGDSSVTLVGVNADMLSQMHIAVA